MESLRNGDYMIVAIDAIPDDSIIAHFVSVMRDGNLLNYFNSYGIEVPKQILEYGVKSGIEKIAWNNSLYQTESNLCGFFSCYVIDELMKGRKLEDICNDFYKYPREELNRDVLYKHFSEWAFHKPYKIVGGDILSNIDKMVGGMPEMHLWKGTPYVHSFTGPFTKLNERLNPDGTWKEWSKPVDRVDLASYHHDLKYAKTEDTGERNKADREMIQELNNIPNPTMKEKFERAIVKPIIGTKQFLGV